MAIALNAGSVEAMEANMSATEWADWLSFYHHYDLPDAYFIVSRLLPLLRFIGAESRLQEVVPYFTPYAPPGGILCVGVAEAISFLRSHGLVEKSKPG